LVFSPLTGEWSFIFEIIFWPKVQTKTKKVNCFTALFLSERAPFPFPGFSIMCVGFASVRAFTLSFDITEQ
jgi:hypothetical protein